MWATLLKQATYFIAQKVLLLAWDKVRTFFLDKNKEELDKKIDKVEKDFEKRMEKDEKQILDELDDIDSNL